MKDNLKKIIKYFNLANYITVLEMYVKDNILLERALEEKDLKNRAVGHWGTSPGINFIFAHLNNYSKRKNKKIKIVVGTGHSGASVLANLFIDGTLEKYYGYTRDYNGLHKLVNDYGSKIRTEINPQYPDTYYDGGELGYSLSVSYGLSLNSKDLVVCIIGDGEAETGTLSSSFNLVKILKNTNVLPIINLNKYKMGSRTILSKMTDNELVNYFNSLGYKTIIVETHKQMYRTLDKLNKYKNPLIIFKSNKGFTAKNDVLKIEDTINSHKNPLSKTNKNQAIQILNQWLKSYHIKELIEPDILDNLLVKPKEKETILKLPNIYKYESYSETKSNMVILKNYLRKIMNENNFYIFSPDELGSNKLPELMNNSKTIEILNENICQGLYQGYVQNNNYGIYISYEAFMPIITSMVSQYMKYIYQSKKTGFRIPKSSLTYILTSTCYENNFSHQNPEFINSILDKEYDFINILYPKDSNNLLLAVDKCLKTKDYINVITVSKGIQKQYQELKNSNIDIEILIDHKNPDITLVITGDYLLKIGYEIINELPHIKINLVYVTNLKLLDSNNRFKEAMNDKEFNKYFKTKDNIYLFHGYKSVIRNLLYNRKQKFDIYGFMDKSDICGSVKDKLSANLIDKNYIKKIIEVKYEQL